MKSDNVMKFVWALTFVATISKAFLPSPVDDYTTYTHADITRYGVYRAIHTFLENNNFVNESFDAISEFFGQGE